MCTCTDACRTINPTGLDRHRTGQTFSLRVQLRTCPCTVSTCVCALRRFSDRFSRARFPFPHAPVYIPILYSVECVETVGVARTRTHARTHMHTCTRRSASFLHGITRGPNGAEILARPSRHDKQTDTTSRSSHPSACGFCRDLLSSFFLTRCNVRPKRNGTTAVFPGCTRSPMHCYQVKVAFAGSPTLIQDSLSHDSRELGGFVKR